MVMFRKRHKGEKINFLIKPEPLKDPKAVRT